MNKLTMVGDQVAEVNRRKALKRQVARYTRDLKIASPTILMACDLEIEAAEKALKHIEDVSYCQILDFPALDFADKLGAVFDREQAGIAVESNQAG